VQALWCLFENNATRKKKMQEQEKQQHIPVKVYRTEDRVMIAAPMAGLEPENIRVEVTKDGLLILHGDERALLKDVKELLLDEWSVGAYHRELALSIPVNAAYANVTYGNGVLMVVLPISEHTVPARLVLERVTPTHGEHKGNAGHLVTRIQT
jgi:HSP20 family protein